jgi:hypothetical protein
MYLLELVVNTVISLCANAFAHVPLTKYGDKQKRPGMQLKEFIKIHEFGSVTESEQGLSALQSVQSLQPGCR